MLLLFAILKRKNRQKKSGCGAAESGNKLMAFRGVGNKRSDTPGFIYGRAMRRASIDEPGIFAANMAYLTMRAILRCRHFQSLSRKESIEHPEEKPMPSPLAAHTQTALNQHILQCLACCIKCWGSLCLGISFISTAAQPVGFEICR